MENQKSYINNYEMIGRCLFMCPRKETQLREREGLLHKFERLLEDSSTPGQTTLPQKVSLNSCPHRHYNKNTNFSNRENRKPNRRNLPKADKMKTVKTFARSAAGLDKTCPDDLRPPQVLQQTVYYLCTQILPRSDEPINVIYDFIFDRLRSVRQDLVIQRISDHTAIQILETIINFHVYAAYRCRNETIQNFDPHINTKHLIDCLKRLISLYELNDYWEPSRNIFEALYIIICPDSSNVLSRALSIRHLLKSKTLQYAIEMSLAYQFRNYVQYFRKVNDLPPLLASYVVQHTRHMRSTAYQVISVAYGNKTCKFPLHLLTTILLYNNVKENELNLRQIGIDIITDDNGDKFARFIKNNSSEIPFKLDKINNELNLLDCDPLSPYNIEFIAKELICPWKDIRIQV